MSTMSAQYLIMSAWGAPYFLVSSLLLLSSTEARGQGVGGEGDQAQIAVIGFQANKSSFPYFTCRYRATRAEANTFQDALNGKWKNASACDYRQVVDGELELIECLASLPVIDKNKPADKQPGAVVEPKTGIAMTSHQFISNKVLTNGSEDISYSPSLDGANLFNAKHPVPPVVDTPWSMGLMGHGRKWFGPDALSSKTSQYSLSARDPEVYKGQLVYSMTFSDATYGGITTFKLDPSQGHLPVYISQHYPRHKYVDGHPRSQSILLSAKPCSKNRWFPYHSRLIRTPQGTATSYS